MSNKVALIYENDEFAIYVNDIVVDTDKNGDIAFESFKQVIKNNSMEQISQFKTWEDILVQLNDIRDNRLLINNEYNTLGFENMKYFYKTGKLLFLNTKGMTELIGGFNLFGFIINMVTQNKVKSCNEILEFCNKLINCKVNYSINEVGILVTSAAFSYGSAEYNFETEKMHIGTSIEKATFEDYKKYVLSIIER